MEKPIQGSLGVASSFQLTEEMEALDKQSKNLLKYKEVIAVIQEKNHGSLAQDGIDGDKEIK